jgi:lysozyme
MISATLLAFVKAREGCVKDNGDGTFSAVLDTNANPPIWNIGYGTTGYPVGPSTLWTQAQCDAALVTRLTAAQAQLLALSPNVAWPPGAEDSLTDFIYNEGSGNYQGSTVRKCVAAGDWAEVKTHLLDWEFAGGKRLGGLVTRREGEAAMIGGPTTV